MPALRFVNQFPEFEEVDVFICDECGEPVQWALTRVRLFALGPQEFWRRPLSRAAVRCPYAYWRESEDRHRF